MLKIFNSNSEIQNVINHTSLLIVSMSSIDFCFVYVEATPILLFEVLTTFPWDCFSWYL